MVCGIEKLWSENPLPISAQRPGLGELPNETEPKWPQDSFLWAQTLWSWQLSAAPTDGTFSLVLRLFLFLTLHSHRTLWMPLGIAPVPCLSVTVIFQFTGTQVGWLILYGWAQCTSHVNSVSRAEWSACKMRLLSITLAGTPVALSSVGEQIQAKIFLLIETPLQKQ